MIKDMNLREQVKEFIAACIALLIPMGIDNPYSFKPYSKEVNEFNEKLRILEQSLADSEPQLKTEEEWVNELSEQAAKYLSNKRGEMYNDKFFEDYQKAYLIELAEFAIEVNKQLIFQLEQKNL